MILIKKHIYSLLIVVLVTAIFFSTVKIIKQKSKTGLNEKIILAYNTYSEYDYCENLDEIIEIVVSNEINIKDDFVRGRFLYLKFIKSINSKSLLSEATITLEEVIKIAKKNNDKELEGTAYHAFSVVENSNGNNLVGIEYTKKALILLEKYGSKHQLVDVYYNLANSSMKLKRWNDVIKYSDKAFDLIKIFDYKINREPYLHIFKANAYIFIGFPDRAISELNSAKTKAKDNKSIRLETHLTYAKLYKKEKLYAKSNNELLKYSKLINEHIGFSNKDAIRFKKDMLLLTDNISKSKDEIILRSKYIIILLIFFFILSCYFLIKKTLFFKLIVKELNKKEILRDKLTLAIENTNKSNLKLKASHIEFKKLMQINKETLLSNTLDIYKYENEINQIELHLSKIIKAKKQKRNNDLFKLEKSLSDLIIDKSIWEDFKNQFKKIRPDFFNNLKSISSELSINDLKHCTYVVAKLSTKEVASLINLSYRSVETTRYRIKKKLNLDKNSSLYDFLSSL